MITSLIQMRDTLHAQFCYQAFITPIFIPLEKEYREFAKRACEFMEAKRTEIIHQDTPRHHVLHRFTPQKNSKNKKILITHGWISRAAYMARLIQALFQQGYEVYALDFPAHGDAKGLQLPWTDAVAILKDTINQHGPFFSVIGHSFGGSMLLNTLNISGQLPQWHLRHKPQRAILIASPVQMRGTVNQHAKRFKLSGQAYLQLCQFMQQQAAFDIKLVGLNHFIAQSPDVPFLCIHGEKDETISPKESIEFCKKYRNSRLCLLPDANHASVLLDNRVEQIVCDFLEGNDSRIDP
jgi:alpha-beta hydrolase superfamily lysophospholipase